MPTSVTLMTWVTRRPSSEQRALQQVGEEVRTQIADVLRARRPSARRCRGARARLLDRNEGFLAPRPRVVQDQGFTRYRHSGPGRRSARPRVRRCPPSSRPTNPSRSVLVTLTLTGPTSKLPSAAASERASSPVRREARRLGDHRGVDIADRKARGRHALDDALQDFAARDAGERRVRRREVRPRSPCPSAPSRALATACSSTSPSECPSSPRSNGISTPAEHQTAPSTSGCASTPCPTSSPPGSIASFRGARRAAARPRFSRPRA